MTGGAEHSGHAAADFRRRFFVCLVLTVPVIVLSQNLPLVPGGRFFSFRGVDLALLALSTAVFLYGGKPFFIGFAHELRERSPGMMTLVAVATTTAYGYSVATVLGLAGAPLYWELSTLVDIMLLGHWIEMRSVGQASAAVEALARLVPADAHRQLPDGGTEDVPVSALLVGDVVLVRPGERVPADGVVVDGASAVDESLLTGESVPIEKAAGAKVIGGSANGEGALAVEVERVGAESFLSQVIALVREAQASRSHTQDLADRAAMWLTVVALAGGAATLVVWLGLGAAPAFAIERAVTVMVIACPHALGLAIPLVVAVSTSLAARGGLLVRDRTAFERARLVDTVVFDKTGTLTLGRFGVSDVATWGSTGREELLILAGSVEALSEHPIARAVTDAAPRRLAVTEFRAAPGKGAEGRVAGRRVAVVSTAEAAARGAPAPAAEVERLATGGETIVIVLVDGAAVGALALADIVRPESRAAIGELTAMGVASVMLTGDSRAVADRVAAALGIGRHIAEVLPADKAGAVAALRAEGRVVAMVGDGVNDAPALAMADVGIAIGAGTDVAVSAADIVLVRRDPRDVAAAIRLARSTYRKMAQNLAWASGYNAVAIPLAAGVLSRLGLTLGPAAGAALMAASTVIVAVNARMLRAA